MSELGGLGIFREIDILRAEIRSKLGDAELSIDDADCGLTDEDYNRFTECVIPFVLELAQLAFKAGMSKATWAGYPGMPDSPNFKEWLVTYLKHLR